MASLDYDKEEMIQQLIAATGISVEEFLANYILEEYPIEFTTVGSLGDLVMNEFRLAVHQNFRIRPKTEDEKQTALQMKEN